MSKRKCSKKGQKEIFTAVIDKQSGEKQYLFNGSKWIWDEIPEGYCFFTYLGDKEKPSGISFRKGDTIGDRYVCFFHGMGREDCIGLLKYDYRMNSTISTAIAIPAETIISKEGKKWAMLPKDFRYFAIVGGGEEKGDSITFIFRSSVDNNNDRYLIISDLKKDYCLKNGLLCIKTNCLDYPEIR